MRGWLSLGGGDEFGRHCERGDRSLIEAVGGTQKVAIIPTAQADGNSNPERAGNNGVRYFERLGAQADNVMITDRQSAGDPTLLNQIADANLIYLIGGNPGYLLNTLRDTPAMQMIADRWLAGATLCGSSAGSMVLCAAQIGRFSGSVDPWIRALGLVPKVLAAVHHERMPDSRGWELLRSLPEGYEVIGVDACAIAAWRPDGLWQMLGEGAVRVYRAGRQAPERFTHGQTWPGIIQPPQQ